MIPSKLLRMVALLVLLGAAGGALSACNTFAGMGEDVSAVGKATTGAAEGTSEAIDKATTEEKTTTP